MCVDDYLWVCCSAASEGKVQIAELKTHDCARGCAGATTGGCAWCGIDLPAQRRGRKGKRVFCSTGHQWAHTSLALRMGQQQLDGYGRPAEAVGRTGYCLINSCVRSVGVCGVLLERRLLLSPSEALAHFLARRH